MSHKKITLQYPVFDGEKIWENSTVVIENGTISDESVFEQGESKNNCLLIPGLIDTHTHIDNNTHIKELIKHGVTATCDVCIPPSLKKADLSLNVFTSYIMAMGDVDNGKAFVEQALALHADYVKVILEEPARMASKTMEPAVLRDIVAHAHKNGKKVAAHAVTIPMVRMAVDADIDILIHVPMREPFPRELAEQIAKKGIAIVPTLVMMEALSHSTHLGYKQSDYQNAEAALRMLHELGVPILAGTDANEVAFVPKVSHGSSLHRELELQVKAGLTPIEVLQGATGKNAAVFGINGAGTITPGNSATMLLIEGRPDKNIVDSTKIKQIWIEGDPIL